MFEASDRHDELLLSMWSTVVEAKLLDSTHERRCSALLVFGTIIGRLRGSQSASRISLIPRLLTRRFLKCIITTLSNSNAILHSAAKDAVSKLQATCELTEAEAAASDNARSLKATLDRMRLGVVSALICNGDRNFDRRTKTKVVANMLKGVSKTEVEKYVSHYRTRIDAGDIDGDDFIGACEALYAVTKIDFGEASEVSLSVAKTLMAQFFINGKSNDGSDARARKVCRIRLLNVIADMCTRRGQNADAGLDAIRKLQDSYEALGLDLDDETSHDPRMYVVSSALKQAKALRSANQTLMPLYALSSLFGTSPCSSCSSATRISALKMQWKIWTVSYEIWERQPGESWALPMRARAMTKRMMRHPCRS